MSKTEYLKPKGVAINPAYSHVAVASGARTIYIAGQVAIDENGGVVGAGDLAAQTEQVMRNLGLCLTAAGASFADVVKITTYITDLRHRLTLGQCVKDTWGDIKFPTNTLIGVAALAFPEMILEVDATAIVAIKK